MAVGQPQAQLNIPSTSELIGIAPPAVTPSSVAQMSDALRQGFLTADDIIARTGKRAQLKEKADVLALTEQMSPEAIQARRAGLTESLARSNLGAAQAQAGLPLVEPTARLQQTQLEQQLAYQKYPAAKLFDQYAPVLGLSEPMTPDKQIDWSRKASIGIQIGEHLRLQNEAKEKLANITTEKSADGSVIAAFTKQGIPVDSAEVQRLETQSRSPFKSMEPGTAQVAAPAPVVAPIQDEAPAPMIEAAPDVSILRAQLINQGKIDAGAALSDEEILQRFPAETQPTATPIVAPRAVPAKPVIAPATAAPAIGTPIGGGFSLGPPKSTAAGLTHYTETQQKALGALVRGLASQEILLNQQEKTTGFNPADIKSQLRMSAYERGTLGQIAASIGQMTESERKYASASQAWLQGLLRAESGAAIATREQDWYRSTFFPVAGDTPAVQAQKAGLRKSMETTFEQVIQGKMNPEEYQVFRDTIKAENTTPSASAPAATTATAPPSDIITTPSGQRLQRTSVPGYFIIAQ